jgi:nucleotide-binding universal stress UspA family protein
MKRKILIAVGDCIHSKGAVTYAARISSATKEMIYTLFHVQPSVPSMLRDVADREPGLGAEIEELVEKHSETAACVPGFKRLMMEEGISGDHIEVVAEPMKVGMAKDILNRAERGQYDAIVIARRALTPTRDFFIGTTAAKVVEHALITPVWVVGGQDTSMSFMLAVDGSENSLRDVEHIGNVIGPNPEFRLTLFHVLPYLRHYYSLDVEKEYPNLQEILHGEDEQRMDKFYKEAKKRLKGAGLRESQIEIKTNRRSHDISTAVLEEARRGGYSTIVVGRRGERDAFFTGRIAMRLVQKVTEQTLWVLP